MTDPDCAVRWTNTRKQVHRESKAISVSMAHVSIKINGACFVSGGVNSPIQFPPGIELHRQGLGGGGHMYVCVCVCGV